MGSFSLTTDLHGTKIEAKCRHYKKTKQNKLLTGRVYAYKQELTCKQSSGFNYFIDVIDEEEGKTILPDCLKSDTRHRLETPVSD